MTHRIIALIDMDCFYCQVESRIDTNLAGKPMAVVQYNDWKGGGIIAVNYEARAFGVTRQMRGDDAKEKCGEIQLVKVPEVRGKADLTKYRDAGKEVIDVLLQFGGVVERASIDEAYIDISCLVEAELEDISQDVKVEVRELPSTFVVGYDNPDKDLQYWINHVHNESNFNIDHLRLLVGAKIVEKMRAEIFKQTKFRCSAGIAHNKMLAKFACGIKKPNKQTILPHDQVAELFTSVPIGKLRGLGGKLGADVCMKFDCEYVSDLAKLSINEIRKSYDDKTAHWLFNISRGLDTEEVKERDLPKSIGCSKNFRGPEILDSREKVEYWMKQLCEELSLRLTKDLAANKRVARGLTISVTQEGVGHRTLSGPLCSYETARSVRQAMELISKLNQSKDKQLWKPRLLNVGVSSSKFEDLNSVGKGNSVANFFGGPKEANLNTNSCRINSDIKVADNNLLETDSSEANVPLTLAKELFPSLWHSTPSLNYDASLIESLPLKLKTKVKERIKLVQQFIKSSQSELPETTVMPIENDKTLFRKPSSEPVDGFSYNSDLTRVLSDQANIEQGLSDKNHIGELEQCPKCSSVISPFDLPEHLDLHLAREVHKEIQQDFRNHTRTSKIENSSNDIQSNKRKCPIKDVTSDKSNKKQANITNFLVRK